MKYAYTAILNPEGGGFSVYFPDLPGCNTCGDDMPDTLKMAQDALCLWLYDMEQDKKAIPAPTPPQAVKTSGNEFISVISVDTDLYRRYYENKAVKKTLTIPMWLDQQAADANINFSQILQEALKQKLDIAQ